MYKIMLVDDEENILKSLNRLLKTEKRWEIELYTSAIDALKRANTTIFDVVISDCMMPDMDGLEFLSQLRQLQPDAMRILLTGSVNIETLMSAINKACAFRFITKPWEDALLLSAIWDALWFRDIIVENRMLAEKVREQESDIMYITDFLKEQNIDEEKYRRNRR